ARLRQYRRDAGSPSYRALAKLVHVQQNSLSQIANGKRVGWGRVLLYVEALRMVDPSVVTTLQLAELKQLHDVGERRHEIFTEQSLRQWRRARFWDQVDAVTEVSARAASKLRPPGRWDTTPRVTDVARLNLTRHLKDLYVLLHEVAAGFDIDLHNPSRSRPGTTIAGFEWFAAAEQRPSPSTPQVRQAGELTLPLLLEVVRLCGGTDGDCRAWQSTWDRLHREASSRSPQTEPDRPPIDLLIPADAQGPNPPGRHRRPKTLARTRTALGIPAIG
ncbi:helix-turn-helix domain-containing protein, partial [Actinoplanes sp. RD1]|uniref:helix-turn-helix domain-containing protein n=1 Tax=Actinoplanes sp. RD1 TaxID=3064538 RepID=UPI002741DCF3